MVIVAVGVGVGGTAIEAARRTASAYPRALAALRAPDLVVDFDLLASDDPEQVLEAIDRIPGVVDRTDSAALAITRFDGEVADFAFPENMVASVEGRRFYVTDAVTVLTGRMPDPHSSTEVLANRQFADEAGVHVGDQLELGTLNHDEAAALFDPTLPHADPELVTFTVVGIGLLPEEAVKDDAAGKRLLVASPAAWTRWSDGELFRRSGLVLAPGTDVDQVQHDLRSIIARHAVGEFSPPQFENRQDLTARTQRSVRPVTLGLGIVGFFVALAAIVIAGQLLARQIAGGSETAVTLRALGSTRRATCLALIVPAMVSVAAGLILALIVAIIASPIGPVGPLRDIEPARGIAVDWVVMGAVVAAAVILVAARVLGAGAAVVRQASGPSRPSTHSSWVADRLVTGGAPLSAQIGVRRTFAAGTHDTATVTTTRLALATMACGVGIVAAVVTFGAGLDHLLATPRLFGNGWDANSVGSGGIRPTRLGGPACRRRRRRDRTGGLRGIND